MWASRFCSKFSKQGLPHDILFFLFQWMSAQIWEGNHVKIKSKIAEEEEKCCLNISESNTIACISIAWSRLLIWNERIEVWTWFWFLSYSWVFQCLQFDIWPFHVSSVLQITQCCCHQFGSQALRCKILPAPLLLQNLKVGIHATWEEFVWVTLLQHGFPMPLYSGWIQ